jgi:signal transduction histidine kinase
MKIKITLFFSFLALVASSQDMNLDSLRVLLKHSKGDAYIKNLLNLCWEYRFLNADSARSYGFEALELAQKAKNRELEVEALHNIGVTHEAQGNYQDALKLEMQALVIRKELGDSLKTANTLNNIGIIHDEQGRFDLALNYYYQARKIYEQLGDLEKMGMVYLNIGVVLKAQEDYVNSVKYYRNALAIYKKLDKKFGVAACYANLGSIYYYLPNYDSALYYSLLGTEEFKKQNIRQFLPTTLCNSGMAYHKLGQNAKAKEYLLEALHLNEEYDNKKEIAFTLTYLAEVLRLEKNYAAAEKNLSQALDIAHRIEAQQQVMEAERVLADVYLDQKNFQRSLEEFKKYVAVKDTLFRKEKAKQIAELQAKYDSDKKESEIKLLKQENELQQARLQFNYFLLGALVLMLASLVLLGYLFRNRMALKQRVELEETKAALRALQLQAVITSQEEERKRFAADLHDGLGQLISAVRLSLSKEEVERRSIDQAVEVLNEMNTEIRNIAFNLMPQVLIKSGLKEALDELAGRVNRSGRVKILVNAFDLEPIEDTESKVALYRICQEWTNNILKYGRATQVNVQLVQHHDELVITIEDNGEGFDTSVLGKGQGNGWKNINSRLSIIGGAIDIDSVPGRHGTTVIITVPRKIARAA